MRRYQHNRILQIISTLKEAVSASLSSFRSGDAQAVAGLLEECLYGAAGLHEFINELKGEGTRTALLLGGFTWVIQRCFEDAEDIDEGFIDKRMRDLDDIVQIATEELMPDRLEVVFFPYKASMWDALESVWRAAAGDPRCDVYVVPIPYYERTSDGRMGRMYYEGGQYPDYVPVTDWRKYDVKERYPDAVFIHNPYDEANLVTSVHPDYYSKSLRDMTDMLCYIPYFVTGSSIADHFCTCPGVIYAHRVFVESERMRSLYMRAFGAFARETALDKSYADMGKFAALGSPKYDSVVNAKPEDFLLPKAWRRLLTKPDGSPKQAVLYNTSLGTMLACGAGYIEKLKTVIETFRRMEDVVLWWRPHPLSEATFKSMLPALRDGYMGVVDAYKRANAGIYDDTADLNRAMCLNAAYYGDYSSLTFLYQLTGKPLMIQVPQIRPGAQGPAYNVAPGCLCEYGGYYWFPAMGFNTLFRMDKASRAVTYMGVFPGEPMLRVGLYQDCAVVGSRIYFAPSNAGAITVYDTHSGAFERIELPQVSSALPSGLAYNQSDKFKRVMERDGILYFIPSTYPGILALNTHNGRLTVLGGWVTALCRLANGMDNAYFHSGVIDGGKLMLACACANAALEIDLTTHTHTLHRFGSGDNYGYTDICMHSGAYWLLPLHGAGIVRWKSNQDIMAYRAEVTGDASQNAPLFQRIMASGDNLFILPYMAMRMMRFNVSTRQLSLDEGFRPSGMSGDVPDYYTPAPFQYMTAHIDGHFFMLTGLTNTLLEYDPSTGALREDALRLTPEDTEALRAWARDIGAPAYEKSDDYIMVEYPFVGLEDYLDLMTDEASADYFALSRDARAREIVSPDGTAGDAIFNVVKEAVFGHV